MKVLFLCTGNYYRSRFAEEYFNALAKQRGLLHKAASRGLADQFEKLKNPGPMSFAAIKELKKTGIRIAEPIRFPKKLMTTEISAIDIIICMNKKEHRPYIRKIKELRGKYIKFWDIKDLDQVPADVGLSQCRERVENLLEEISDRYK